MAVFRYQAVDAEQLSVKGAIAADTPRQAREELRARGLRVRALEQQRSARSSGFARRSSRRRHVAEWAVAVYELAMLHPGRKTAYEIICLGADGREGGEGADKDISSEDVDRTEK